MVERGGKFRQAPSRPSTSDHVDEHGVDEITLSAAVREFANTPPAPHKPEAELKTGKTRRAIVAAATVKPKPKKANPLK
jgi:hypothetical protein